MADDRPPDNGLEVVLKVIYCGVARPVEIPVWKEGGSDRYDGGPVGCVGVGLPAKDLPGVGKGS